MFRREYYSDSKIKKTNYRNNGLKSFALESVKTPDRESDQLWMIVQDNAREAKIQTLFSRDEAMQIAEELKHFAKTGMLKP